MRLWLVALLLPLTACSGDDGEWWEDPPEGTRWVGYDGRVVAVPDWWTTGETTCGEPVEDTVWFDSGVIYRCVDPAHPSEVREASSLAVRDQDGEVELVVTVADEGDGDADEIRESERALPDVEPALGTPIEEGGRVKVTVMGTSGP